ncbi:MAG: hypothetical protein L6V35_02640 [Alistipes putredinis]|nr:MAG: hypothetical protein L6V35_02640 [Alistipes putredinis]
MPQAASLLYSRGYNTLFNEWLTTGEALSHARCMPESVVFPFPKIPVRIEIWRRDKAKRWQLGFSQDIDPQKGFVRKASADCDVFRRDGFWRAEPLRRYSARSGGVCRRRAREVRAGVRQVRR